MSLSDAVKAIQKKDVKKLKELAESPSLTSRLNEHLERRDLLIRLIDLDDYIYERPTLLQLASEGGSWECARILLEAKASVDTQSKLDYYYLYGPHRTALMAASKAGYISIVQGLLTAGANRFLKDYLGKTAADLAQTDEIRKLIISFSSEDQKAKAAEEQKAIKLHQKLIAEEREKKQKEVERMEQAQALKAADRARQVKEAEERRLVAEKHKEEKAILEKEMQQKLKVEAEKAKELATDVSKEFSAPVSKVLEEKIAKETPPLTDMTSKLGEIQISLSIAYESLSKGRELGKGGFGTVYKGEWNLNDVAIKELHNTRFTSEAIAEFRQEINVMAKMRSNYIVQILGVCESPKYCLVMEYLPKGSLFDLLHNGQPLPWDIRYRIASDITYGLAQLHGVHILHRDLKSLNILLDDRLRAKLADFGSSKMKTETTSTSTGSSKSTLAWTAPEMLKRGSRYTPDSDIYSYGMVLWEIASRKVPFMDASNMEVMRGWIRDGETETIPEEVEKDQPRFAELIKSCWQGVGKRPTAMQAASEMKSIMAVPGIPTQTQTQTQTQASLSDPAQAPPKPLLLTLSTDHKDR